MMRFLQYGSRDHSNICNPGQSHSLPFEAIRGQKYCRTEIQVCSSRMCPIPMLQKEKIRGHTKTKHWFVNDVERIGERKIIKVR